MRIINLNFLAIFLLILSLLFIRCSSTEEKNEKSSTDSSQSKSDTSGYYTDPTLPPSADYTGDHIVKYNNGITYIRGFFRFGKKHGKWASFFPSGELESETEYVNGIRSGKSIVWHQNGKIMYEGNYRNDSCVGEWLSYDTMGLIIEKKQYK